MKKKGNARGFWIIIALVAVIGFMTGCDNPTNPGDDFVAVISITGVPTSGTVGNLTLTGMVNPLDATNKAIAWSVVSAGTTGATVNKNTLTTQADGTVTVRAIIANGSAQDTNYTQDFSITINPVNSNPTDITYTVKQTGGTNGVTDSGGIMFTFSASVDSLNLTAADITVGGAASSTAALSGSGTTWTLPITVSTAGTATVTITKSGIESGTKRITVYKAGQTAPEYWSITWNFNGGAAGTGEYPDQIEKGETLAKPSPDPTKTDNAFGGWYTDSALTQTYNFANPVTADLNLYAKWEAMGQPPEYWSITWNFNGGAAGTGEYPDQIEKGETLAKPSPDPTKTDNTFGGWYTDSALTQTYNFANPVTADLNLYAKWEAGQTDPGTGELSFELITSGSNANTYRVRAGTVTGGAVVIPAAYNGLPVTEIGSVDDDGWNNGAFIDTGITAITIPASVTTIGQGAFYSCSSLTSVTFAAGSQIQTTGDFAFFRCTSLTNITIPASVTSIGQGAFYRCTSLTNINLPASVTSIGVGAFYYCTSLTSINIPASITSIGVGAFLLCTSLTSINIPANATIGDGAFAGCSSLTSITVAANNPNYVSEGGILYNKTKTKLLVYPSANGPVTIPANVTSIGNAAFFYTSITSITIPEGVTSIGTEAFYSCRSLTNITIPASVTSIGGGTGVVIMVGYGAFGGCTSLASVTFAAGSQLQTIGDWTFYGCSSLTNITIPASVTSIGKYAFSMADLPLSSSLTTVTFAAGSQLQTIGESAFYGCSRLTSITIPATVTSIGDDAFENWTGSQTIYITGHASQSAADTAWGLNWRTDCYANIVYQG